MDVLRILSSPDMEVRRKCLNITLAMVTGRNVEDIVGLLEKQLTKTLELDYEKVPGWFCLIYTIANNLFT
jgi:coatomer subunit beta